jgi:hypothetical protein
VRPKLLVRHGLLAVVVVLAGCQTEVVPDAGTGPSPDSGQTRGFLRFKGPERLTFDLAGALSLPPEEVCTELGQYVCASVHAVALGGVDPYAHGLFEPLPVTGSTTSLVVDRLALSACGTRVARDLATPGSAVIFRDLPIGSNGQLLSPTSPAVRAAITRLVQRSLLREPTEAELSSYEALLAEVVSQGGPAPAREWMRATCFAVTTSMESVFY